MLGAQKNNARIALYGAGNRGKLVLSNVMEILGSKYRNHLIFIDSDRLKQGTEINGIPVTSLENAVPADRRIFILITADCYRPIYDIIKRYDPELLKHTFYCPGGMNWEVYYPQNWNEIEFIERNIKDFEDIYKMLYDSRSRKVYVNLLNYRLTRESKYILDSFSDKRHYFDTDIFGEGLDWFRKEERTYLDVGAYTGDTLEELLLLTEEKFSKIYCFEVDSRFCEQIKQKYKAYNDILVYPFALGAENAVVNYDSRYIGSPANRISLMEDTIDVKLNREMLSFDSLKIKDKIDYIKMDIEGAEYDALLGMKATIMHDKPIMAISVYHCQSDYIRIAQLLKQYVPEYRLFLRHYSEGTDETVLYALI